MMDIDIANMSTNDPSSYEAILNLTEMFKDANRPRDIYEMIYIGYMPFCVVVGLVGNGMVWVLIRSNRTLARLPTNLYLLALAVMSSIFLLSLLIFWFEQDLMEQAVVHGSTWGCKTLNFLAHFCDFSTVWLIVLVGVERLLLLQFRKRTLSLESARMHILVLISIAIAYNSWILFVADLDKDGECDIDQSYAKIYEYFIYFETIALMIVPSSIILVCNILLIFKLKSHLKRIPSSPTVSFHTTSEGPLTTMTTNGYRLTSTRGSLPSTHYCVLDSSVEVQPLRRSKKKGGIRSTDLQLTRSLLFVTWSFVILNLPNYTYRTVVHFFNADSNFEGWWMQKFSFLAHFLLYTHHAFLFYIYIFYSPQMKRKLKPTALKLLECYCLKPEIVAFSERS